MPLPLLAVHGALMQGAALLPLGAALGRETLAPGLPAHRRGPPWEAHRDYHDQAYEAVCAALPEGPVDVFGQSYGGTLALRLAVEHPERVRSLVLFEAVAFAAAAPGPLAHHREEMETFHGALKAGREGTAAALFYKLWGTGAEWESLPDVVRKAMLRLLPVIPATEPGILADRPGVIPRLSACDVPTLLLQHVGAPEITTAINEGLRRRMPRAQIREVEGDGRHLMPNMDPKAVASEVAAFWDQLC